MVKVEKPWGHEIHWAKTDNYVGKLLFIKAGHRLSKQYHVEKEETVLVLKGVLYNYDKDDKIQQELMFRMKLRIFEKDEVKNAKDKDAEKSDIRKAETPLDVILSYATVINKLGKRFKK